MKAINHYKAMWTIVMFDLPVTTPLLVKHANKFRNMLLDEGFFRMQFSIYCRPTLSQERADVFKKRIKNALPQFGHVRILQITDAQYAKTESFFGNISQKIEEKPEQLSLF